MVSVAEAAALEQQISNLKLENISLVSQTLEQKAVIDKLTAELDRSRGSEVLDEIEQGTVVRLEATIKRLRAAVETAVCCISMCDCGTDAIL